MPQPPTNASIAQLARKRGAQLSCYRVEGDRCAPHYFDGEAVPVEVIGPTKDFTSGELYVYRWNGDVFLKRLFGDGGSVEAHSLNPAIRNQQFGRKSSSFAVLARVVEPRKQQFYAEAMNQLLNE